MDKSRIPKFYKLSIPERLRILNERKIITNSDYRLMSNGKTGLQPNQADKIVENVIEG